MIDFSDENEMKSIQKIINKIESNMSLLTDYFMKKNFFEND